MYNDCKKCRTTAQILRELREPKVEECMQYSSVRTMEREEGGGDPGFKDCTATTCSVVLISGASGDLVSASVFMIDRLLAYERYEPSPDDVVLKFFGPKKLTVAGRLGRPTSQAFCRHTIAIRQPVRRGSYCIT